MDLLSTHVSSRDEYGNKYYTALFDNELEYRWISLNGPITEDTSSTVKALIRYFNRKSKDKPIILEIQSKGGELSAGLSIVDSITLSKAPVYTYCTGECDSAAAFILASGAKRYSDPNCRICIHEAIGQIQGRLTDTRIQFSNMKASNDRYTDLMAGFITNISKADLENMFVTGDTYMWPTEGKTIGLIDIIGSPEEDVHA